MADPTPYAVEYSFSGWQATNPSRPLPGASVDNELANIATSIDEIIDALIGVRRSDGALQNSIVTYDSLDAEMQAQIGVGLADAVDDVAASAAAAAASVVAASDYATSAAGYAATAAAYIGMFTGTSTTSTAIATGSKSFTTQPAKYFNVDTFLLLVSAANPNNYVYGPVTAYDSVTGALTVNVTVTGGSGTLADWNIYVSGARGPAGSAGSPGAGTGDMLAANNLSDVVSKATGRTNMGLGTGDTVVHNVLQLNAATSQIVLDADGTNKGTVSMAALAANRTWTLPDKTGTVAMTSDIPASTGLVGPGIVAGNYYHSPFDQSGSTGTLAANTLYGSLVYIQNDVTITKLSIQVATGQAGKSARLGIYANSAGVPGARILDAGTVALDTSGVKEVTGLSQALTGGAWYFFALLSNATTAVVVAAADYATQFFLGDVTVGTGAQGFSMSQAYGALPATFSAPARMSPAYTIFYRNN